MEAAMAGREPTTVELAERVMLDAQEQRGMRIDQAQKSIAEIEARLEQLDQERERAIQSWRRAEESLRAELEGHRAFVGHATEPDHAAPAINLNLADSWIAATADAIGHMLDRDRDRTDARG